MGIVHTGGRDGKGGAGSTRIVALLMLKSIFVLFPLSSMVGDQMSVHTVGMQRANDIAMVAMLEVETANNNGVHVLEKTHTGDLFGLESAIVKL